MRPVFVACFAVLLFVPTAFTKPDPTSAVKKVDWPQWRGPQRNGISAETGLLQAWPEGGPKLLWDAMQVNKGPTAGAGLSSLAITGGKIYTMGDANSAKPANDTGKKGKGKKGGGNRDSVCVFCLDADTGKELWKTAIGPKSAGGPGGGTRCTPTVDGDRVYALTTQGNLVCLKIADGSILWQKDLVKDYAGQRPGFGGYAESPTIDGDKLICTPGGKKNRMVALNKLNGDTYWTCEVPINDGTGFSSIVKAEVGGVKMYITLGQRGLGLFAVEAETGKFLWNYSRVGNGTASIPTALVQGDHVFASTGYGTGSVLLKLTADGKGGVKAKEVYFLSGNTLQNHHGGMVMIGDYIYGGHGHNNGLPFCLEWKTGKLKWGPERGPGDRSAAVLYADGHLYFRYEKGPIALIEATPEGYRLKGSFAPPLSEPAWQHPVIYDGRLYLRGNDQILCYDIRQK